MTDYEDLNIWYLSTNPEIAAMWACDKHICSTLVKYVQIMSTALRNNGKELGYKSIKKDHPCVVWAGANKANFEFLFHLCYYYNVQYKRRFVKNQDHKSFKLTQDIRHENRVLPGYTSDFTYHTPPPLIMPEGFKIKSKPDSYKNINGMVRTFRVHDLHALAYRRYYHFAKKNIAMYTAPTPHPDFMQDNYVEPYPDII